VGTRSNVTALLRKTIPVDAARGAVLLPVRFSTSSVRQRVALAGLVVAVLVECCGGISRAKAVPSKIVRDQGFYPKIAPLAKMDGLCAERDR
jgi:hypothetical protein